MSHTHVVPPSAEGRKLHAHLREVLGGVQTRRLGDLVLCGAVLVDGRSGRIAQRLAAGQEVRLEGDAERDLLDRMVPVHEGPLTTVVEHDRFLVVDKPKGMQIHPMGRHRDGTLVGALLWLAGARPDRLWTDWRPHVVNRLDRPTSGLLVVAKDVATRTALQDQLESGTMRRTYTATVVGAVDGEAGTVDAPLGRDPAFDYRRGVVSETDGGQRAVTHWRVLSRADGATTLEVDLDTGRTHQIRAHLASLGHPIVGDTLYADGVAPEPHDRIALHASRLAFRHPLTGEAVTASSDPPTA